MDVRNCKMCGRLFNYLSGQPICPGCAKEMDKKFEVVKEYIYDNPHSSIQQVSEENEVSIQQLKNWVREERLAFSEDSMVGIECESCGGMIKTGKYCGACKEKIASNLGSAYRKEDLTSPSKEQSKNAKMRFLN